MTPRCLLGYLAVCLVLGLGVVPAFAQGPVPSAIAKKVEVASAIGSFDLIDLTADCSTQGAASQLFPDFEGVALESADDFEVPAGFRWSVEEVGAVGFLGNLGGAALDGFDITIYQDSKGVPGEPVCRYEGLVPDGVAKPSFDVRLPFACQLSAGTYWISVLAVQDFAANGQWFWSEAAGDVANGRQFVFRDQDDLAGTGVCQSWTPATECGLSTPSNDLCFGLSGVQTEGGNILVVPTLDAFGQLTLMLSLLASAAFFLVRRREARR